MFFFSLFLSLFSVFARRSEQLRAESRVSETAGRGGDSDHNGDFGFSLHAEGVLAPTVEDLQNEYLKRINRYENDDKIREQMGKDKAEPENIDNSLKRHQESDFVVGAIKNVGYFQAPDVMAWLSFFLRADFLRKGLILTVLFLVIISLITCWNICTMSFELQRPWTLFTFKQPIVKSRADTKRLLAERQEPNSPYKKKLLSLKQKAVQDYRVMK